LFDSKRGTLDWYCVDHWSEELGIDVPALKSALRERIGYLDGAPEFLDALRGLALTEVFPPDHAALMADNNRRVLEEERPIEFEESLSVGGETRVYTSVKSPLLDDEGHAAGIVGVSTCASSPSR